MKEITLKYVGAGYKNQYQLEINVYDLNSNLIYSGITYNGFINICLKANQYYKITAQSNSQILNSVIYVNCTRDIYIFVLNSSYIPINNVTTFILKDYNYNRPIEKGEILLWKK